MAGEQADLPVEARLAGLTYRLRTTARPVQPDPQVQCGVPGLTPPEVEVDLGGHSEVILERHTLAWFGIEAQD